MSDLVKPRRLVFSRRGSYYIAIAAAEFESDIPEGVTGEDARVLCRQNCDDKGKGTQGSFVSFGKCFCDD